MAQDVSSAADTLEERARHTVLLKKPSIVLLNLEGGGVLGKMHAVYGHDFEKKTGIPLGLATHVLDMTSTGGPFGTGIKIPDPKNPSRPLYSCQNMMDFYDEDCSVMFAQKPSRVFNLVASSGINLAKSLFDPHSNSKDRKRIQAIKRTCDMLEKEVPEDKAPLVTVLRERASKRWLSEADTRAALKICKKLSTEEQPEPKKKVQPYKPTEDIVKHIEQIGHQVQRRSTAQTGRLRTEFTRAVFKALDTVKARLGPRENKYYSPELKKALFVDRMGDLELNNLIGSNYFAAYSPRKKKFDPMFCRRDNLLDLNPQAPAAISHPGMKLWDANMATTANPLAYPPHKTEAGTFAVDKATIHTPIFALSEIFAHRADNLEIVSLTFSTGHAVNDDMSDEELYEYYAENGEAHEGFLDDSKACITSEVEMSMANFLRKQVSKESIFVLSPRMSIKDDEEMDTFPSTDITDASPENMMRTQRRAEKYLRDKEDKVNRIWQTLTDNMYLLGHIDKPTFDEITERLGVKAKLQAAVLPDNVVQLLMATAAELPPSSLMALKI